MSKIGKLPLQVPSGVSLNIEGQNLKVIGPKGTIEKELPRGIELTKNEDNEYVVVSKEKVRMQSHYMVPIGH